MNKHSYIFFLPFLVLICCFKLNAQNNIPAFNGTKIILQSEDKKGNDFTAYSDYGNMTLNTVNGDFNLSFDAKDLKTGDPQLDTLIMSKGTQKIIFKGNIGENLFLFNQQINDEKLYNMPGQLIINNNAIDCVAQFDPLNFGDKADTKTYRIDFNLVIDASKIIILGLENKINKQLEIEVNSGKISTQQP